MMRPSIRPPSLLAALTVFLILPAVSFAQSVGELSSELDGLEGSVNALKSQYVKPIEVDTSGSKYGLQARYDDGRVAYHLGRYQQAASLLHSAVEDPKFASFGSRREGVYMLGDSLYRVRNYVAASEQFRKLLDSGGGEYYEEAAARLLEMAYEIRDFSTLESLFKQLSGSSMSGRIAYLSGKAFYEQGNYQRAQENFARAAQTTQYRMTAEYFRGVSLVAEKKYSEAKRIFTALVNTAAIGDETDQEVVDLSWLALGRIAYEEDDIERAIDNYSRLERSSPHFDRSLWEQTWVLVSRGNYEEARRNVDIITYLDDPDPDILAKSQLLRADLSLELGEYETARADYRAVLDRFGPIQKQMDEFANNHQNLESFFDALMDAGGAQRGMPPLIARWMSTDPEMKEATSVLRAMKNAEESIEETYLMLDQLGGTSARVLADPQLADGFRKAVEIENRLVQIRQLIVDAQLAALEPKMTEEQKTEWAAIATALAELREKNDALSVVNEDGSAERKGLDAELASAQQELNEAGRELENVRAQLTALENLLSGDSGQQISAAERTEATKARDELKKNIEEMLVEEQKLRAEVDELRESNPLRPAETLTRKKYVAKLKEAEAFLNPLGDATEAEAAREKIAEIKRQLVGFFRSLDDMALASVGGLNADINGQRALADKHRQSLQQLITTSESGAGVLAYVNFRRARAEYTEIVLRGEVGIIDVVWKKKEDMTEKISKLFEDRTSELNLLQEAFEEVR